MGDAKAIVVRPIHAREARDVITRCHYSGKVVNNSTLHLGVFLHGALLGAMQFGSPLDRRKVLPLVNGTAWNQMLELNRMAFDERLPRNSESRALAVAFRMLQRHRPDIKWVLSFSDGTQSGDGTIYRASGFVLTGIKRNDGLFRFPDGTVAQRMSLEVTAGSRDAGARWRAATGLYTQSAATLARAAGAVPIPGFQLRYIRFLDPGWRARLAVPVLPFSAIDAAGARMYRGNRPVSIGADASPDQGEEGGQQPTTGLQQ
jgi:hypothetical protein